VFSVYSFGGSGMECGTMRGAGTFLTVSWSRSTRSPHDVHAAGGPRETLSVTSGTRFLGIETITGSLERSPEIVGVWRKPPVLGGKFSPAICWCTLSFRYWISRPVVTM